MGREHRRIPLPVAVSPQLDIANGHRRQAPLARTLPPLLVRSHRSRRHFAARQERPRSSCAEERDLHQYGCLPPVLFPPKRRRDLVTGIALARPLVHASGQHAYSTEPRMGCRNRYSGRPQTSICLQREEAQEPCWARPSRAAWRRSCSKNGSSSTSIGRSPAKSLLGRLNHDRTPSGLQPLCRSATS